MPRNKILYWDGLIGSQEVPKSLSPALKKLLGIEDDAGNNTSSVDKNLSNKNIYSVRLNKTEREKVYPSSKPNTSKASSKTTKKITNGNNTVSSQTTQQSSATACARSATPKP